MLCEPALVRMPRPPVTSEAFCGILQTLREKTRDVIRQTGLVENP